MNYARKRVFVLLTTFIMVISFTINGKFQPEKVNASGSDSTDSVESLVTDMGLGGFVGENVMGNINNWQLNALKNNPNIIEAIKNCVNGKTYLSSIINDYYNIKNYYNYGISQSDIKGYSGNALEFFQYNNTDSFGGIDLTYENDSGAITDWSGARELWVYLNGSEYGTKTIDVRIRIEERDPDTNTREAWTPKSGGKYILISTDGIETAESVNENGFSVLPAKFRGWYRMELNIDNFEEFWADNDNHNNTLDLQDVRQITISLKGNDTTYLSSFYFDAFSIVGNVNGTALPLSAKYVSDSETFKQIWDLETCDPIGGYGEMVKSKFGWGDIWSYFRISVTGKSKGYSGNALEFKDIKSSDNYNDLDLVISKDSTVNTDCTGAEELWIYVDAANYGSKNIPIRLSFEESDPNTLIRESWRPKGNVKTYTITDGTNKKEEKTTNSSGFVEIGSGFKGWIIFPLNSDTYEKYWSGGNSNNVIDKNDIHQFQLNIISNDTALNHSIYVNAFSIVGSAIKNGTTLPVKLNNYECYEKKSFRQVWSIDSVLSEGYSGNTVIWYNEFPGKLLTGMVYCYKLTADSDLKNAIEELVSALIGAEDDDGYFGIYNSGKFGIGADNWDMWGHYQITYGLYQWYLVSGDYSSLEAAEKALDCIINYVNIYNNGSYKTTAGWEMNLSIGHIMGIMYKETHLQKYLDAALQIVNVDWVSTGNWLNEILDGKDFFQTNFPDGNHCIL